MLSSESEGIQMPALSYSDLESESSRTPPRISRRSFEITSSENEDYLPEPPVLIDSSSCITSLSASNSSTPNFHTSPSPSLVSSSASSSASPMSHSDSSLPASQPVRRSRKRASQSEVTERKMSLRSRKM